MKLRKLITQYVAFEKALGKSFRSNEYVLKGFGSKMGNGVEITDVEPRRVVAFLTGAGGITRNWHRKYSALAGFYRYAVSRGYAAFAPLPTVVPKPPEKFVPYIYTSSELSRLFTAISFYPNRKNLLERDTFRTILLLLYGAGLRLNEALSLRLNDVHLSDAVIIIRDTKFYKTRTVPLGSQLHRVLTRYRKERGQAGSSQDANTFFFLTRSSRPVPDHLVQRCFWRLLAHAGVDRTGDGRYGPRLHDLRHTFAVHRLIQWYREGADVQRLLPKLSTYLGHINIAATQVYLTMTSELLGEASKRFEQYFLKEGSHV